MNQAIVLKELEQAIFEGKFSKANKNLLSYISEETNKERSYTWKYAELCRRIGRHDWSIKLLNPIVRSNNPVLGKASPEENLEYAAALLFSGASDEAYSLLKKSSAKNLAKSHLIKSYYYMSIWDFQNAMQSIKIFLEAPSMNHYDRCIAEVNLLNCFVQLEMWNEAKSLLESLKTSAKKYQRVYAQACEAGIKIAIAEQNWFQATQYLNEANHFHSQNKDNFFFEKWNTLLIAFKNNFANMTDITNIQRKAMLGKRFQDLREIDLYTAKATSDSWLISKLYYGTPHKKFREKLHESIVFNAGVKIKDPFMYHLDHYNRRDDSSYSLCPHTGINSFSANTLKQGQVLQKLVECLFSDLYTPQSTVSLFAKIYPKQNYNPKNSANQIHQILHRFRSWVEKSEIPLVIRHQKNYFHCESTSPLSIRLTKNKPVDSSLMGDRNTLFDRYKDDYFKSSDIASTLNISQRHATRLVKQLMNEKLLSSYGVGRRTRYYFKEQ